MKSIAIISFFLLLGSYGFGQVFSLSDDDVHKGEYIALYDIHFEFAKAEIIEEQPQLDTLVMFLKRNKFVKVEIGIHSGFRGSDTYNLNMTQQRAQSLKNYLVEKGVNEKLIIVKGFGESKSVIEYEDWKKLMETHRCGYYGKGNRRVTVVIL